MTHAHIPAYFTLSGDTFEERFEKFINLGDDRNIAEVWVAGAQVREGDNFAGVFKKAGRCSYSGSSLCCKEWMVGHLRIMLISSIACANTGDMPFTVKQPLPSGSKHGSKVDLTASA